MTRVSKYSGISAMPISFIFIIFHGAPFICWLCFKARHFQIIRKPEYALRNVFFFSISLHIWLVFTSCNKSSCQFKESYIHCIIIYYYSLICFGNRFSTTIPSPILPQVHSHQFFFYSLLAIIILRISSNHTSFVLPVAIISICFACVQLITKRFTM